MITYVSILHPIYIIIQSRCFINPFIWDTHNESMENWRYPLCLSPLQADCTLQIYNKFLIDTHKTDQHGILAQAPHSSENAKGLIVVQGKKPR